MTSTAARQEWNAPDGVTFPYTLWTVDQTQGQEKRPRAVVVAVHGLSGGAIDFEPLGQHLAVLGIVTIAPELRGQGNDPRLEARGDLAQIDDWFRDLSAFLSLVRCRYPDSQIYYYGESMGAAILTRFLAQAREVDQPAGLILASPVVSLTGPTPWWLEALFQFFLRVQPMYRLNLRKIIKPNPNDPPKLVTRDEAHRRWFETAPHKVDSFTVRFFKRLRELIGGCFEAAPKITVPVLVIYAANDIFIPPAEVEKFFARIGSREKELRFFPESYHLLLHDFDKAEALERIEAWLLRRIEMTDHRQTAEARFHI